MTVTSETVTITTRDDGQTEARVGGVLVGTGTLPEVMRAVGYVLAMAHQAAEKAAA